MLALIQLLINILECAIAAAGYGVLLFAVCAVMINMKDFIPGSETIVNMSGSVVRHLLGKLDFDPNSAVKNISNISHGGVAAANKTKENLKNMIIGDPDFAKFKTVKDAVVNYINSLNDDQNEEQKIVKVSNVLSQDRLTSSYATFLLFIKSNGKSSNDNKKLFDFFVYTAHMEKQVPYSSLAQTALWTGAALLVNFPVGLLVGGNLVYQLKCPNITFDEIRAVNGTCAQNVPKTNIEIKNGNVYYLERGTKASCGQKQPLAAIEGNAKKGQELEALD